VSSRVTVLAPDGTRIAAWVRQPTAELPEGAPTVVLAHGWTLNHHAWDRVVDQLLERTPVRVVSYDQRGHGQSSLGGPRQRSRASVHALGDDLDAVINAVAPHGPLVLGGHSMGGMTVMAFAGTHPDVVHERVRGALLVSTSAGELRGTGRRGEVAMMRALAHLPLLRAGRAVTARGQRGLLFGEEADPSDVEATRGMVGGMRLSVLGAYYDALIRHDEARSLAELASVPTRVLVGERDRLTPVAHSQRIGELLPDAELVVLPGRGHMLGFEAPEVVTDHLCSLVEAAA
jgi:pimeloyl-ACP methyl ester carboxylesterase